MSLKSDEGAYSMLRPAQNTLCCTENDYLSPNLDISTTAMAYPSWVDLVYNVPWYHRHMGVASRAESLYHSLTSIRLLPSSTLQKDDHRSIFHFICLMSVVA